MILLLWALMQGGAPGPDAAGFRRTVVPFFEAYCLDCHDEETRKGKLALDGIDPDVPGGDDFEIWRIIEEQLTFGDMPPAKKRQPPAGQRGAVLAWIRGELRKSQQPGGVAEEKLLLPQYGNYVDHGELFGKRRDRVIPGPPRIWRLRPEIYDALAPRLGEGLRSLSNALNRYDGPEFKDFSAPYFLDEASTLQLLGNAKQIAAAQLGPKSKDRVFKQMVAGPGPPKPGTVEAAIETAFRKALRRGPTDGERERYLAFYRKAAETSDPGVAAKALLTAVLLQPEFMFRQELGDGKPDRFGRVRLAPREIAYALSYALGHLPLDEFEKAGREGKLSTSDQVATAVRARLVDPSRLHDRNPRILQFFREYFDYPNATEVFKDTPEGGAHEPGLLVGDLEFTIREILKADRDVLAQLLTTRKYYVNATWGRKKEADRIVRRHEKHWNYPTAFSLPLDWRWAAHLQPVEFPADERAGVLTHPAWLAAWSGNFDNHPVQRGKWIRTHLLGGTVPDVPIGVDARVPEKEHTTFRDRLKAATSPAECWRCHRKMDPLGLPFERFDHYGRFQRLDAGQPVDVTGAITRTRVPGLDRDVSGPIEMIELLATSEHVEQVFVRHVFRYFMGRNETLGDANTLQDAHRTYRESGGSFNEVVTSVLSSESFLYRQQGGER